MNLTPEQFKDMFHDYTLLKHARFNEETVIWNWAFIDLEEDGLTRIYYNVEDEGSGFSFYVASHIGSLNCDFSFDPDSTVVECLFRGYAFHDGIRHFYMGSEQHDNYGYLFWPDLKDYIKVFEVLIELENKYCNKE